jgi:glycine/sarcosine N-methyltransferase
MADKVLSFYDSLAAYYHLLFEDWDKAIHRQASVLQKLMPSSPAGTPLKILDCACGIGTQAIGLAQMGHRVSASDLSPAAIERARKEATLRSLDIDFRVADMTSLEDFPDAAFDVVVALDNALPHLNRMQLVHALSAIRSKLRSGGRLVASIRDYDQLPKERPSAQPASFFGDPGSRRIVHQVWDWTGNTAYTLHLYITLEAERGWDVHHFVSHYNTLLREEASTVLQHSGFEDVHWLMPQESGYYQPLVMARATHEKPPLLPPTR